MSFTIEKTKNSFELVSAHYLSALGYSCYAMLRFSDFNLKLTSVIGKHQFIETTLRGCIFMTFQDYAEAIYFYAEANNKFPKSYYAKKPTSCILQLDANNLHKHSTMKLLPTRIPNQANPNILV